MKKMENDVKQEKLDSISFSMNTDLLQAINKQVEELGWEEK